MKIRTASLFALPLLLLVILRPDQREDSPEAAAADAAPAANVAFVQSTSCSLESGAILRIQHEEAPAVFLTAAQLSALPRTQVRGTPPDEKESVYEGIAVSELLRLVKAPAGRELRERAMTRYLLVEAADGSRAVFALAEVDPAFTERVIILADRRDRATLAPGNGPLQIVVPGEERHARWVRQVQCLSIRDG